MGRLQKIAAWGEPVDHGRLAPTTPETGARDAAVDVDCARN